MEFLTTYGLFLAKLASIVIAILIIVAGIVAIASKGKIKGKGQLKIKKLNDRYKHYREQIAEQLNDKEITKSIKKTKKEKKKQKRNRLFVLNFHGDVRATAVNNLREEINALLLVAKPEDQVLIRLESAGGLVNAYGLAASQLQRIRDAKLKLTIAVDKVAASGGYMMACVADEIIAAPFAIVGSIGVIAQLPNLHRYLEKKAIDWEQFMAGDYKRTVTVLGKNTDKGREKFQEELEETHLLFKHFIKTHRENVDINKVATGEHWYATQAKAFNLVDRLQTSDDFLLAARKENDLIELQYKIKKSFAERFGASAEKTWLRLSGQELG